MTWKNLTTTLMNLFHSVSFPKISLRPMKLRILSPTVLLIAFTIHVAAQPSLFSSAAFVNKDGDSLNYRLLVPDWGAEKKYPLVVFLHGAGERGNDNDAQLKWGVMNFATDANLTQFPAFVVAPQCPEGDRWANISDYKDTAMKIGEDPSKPMSMVIELIYQLVDQLPVDERRIYITGLSMGGYGTFDAVTRYPDLFAAAVPVCGAGDASQAEKIAHIPMWIFTGAEDATVPPSLTRTMFNALVDAGAKPGYTEFPETGHFSWIATYRDPMMMAWLFRQQKK